MCRENEDFNFDIVSSSGQDSSPLSGQIVELVQKLKGDDKLIASNRLVELYKESKEKVVPVLVDHILPEGDKWSYRVNLYIAFTLGRLRPFWEGTKEQVEKIQSLAQTRNYRDATFKKRADKAISNFWRKT